MKPQPTPLERPPLAARAAQQLQHWEQLRDSLQALHAELEYLRLMLKLNAVKAAPAAAVTARAAPVLSAPDRPA